MVYSILTEARIRHSVAPKQPGVIQYQVVWDVNQDLKDWTTFINMDIVGAWGGFLFATKRTGPESYISPSSNFPPVDALVNDRIFFRLKYDKHPNSNEPTTWGKITWTTSGDPLFNEEKTQTFQVIPDGKWHLYEINMGENPNWVGDINRVRFYPCEDGFVNDEFFLGFLEIGTSTFDFSFDEEQAGSAGYAEGSLPVLGSTVIEKGVNDKLIVNIDGYGDVQITLTPQVVTAFLLARDISLQLGKVAIGGYIRSEVFLTEDQRLRIESGTRATDSSVTIKDGPNSAGRDLGLLDDVGFFIGIVGIGSAPSPTYEPLSSYRPTTLEILAMFDNDDDLAAFALDPAQPLVQGGSIAFDVIQQRLTSTVVLEGRNTGLQGQEFSLTSIPAANGSTFIDLNHPFSDDGKIDKVFMNGVPDRNGGSKWKIFRPSLDGQLTLVYEGVIGQKDFTDDPNGGLVGSPVPDVFAADVSTSNILVRRGDLLGIYNVGLHTGSGSSIKPDALFYEIEGDVTGTLTAPQPSGAGETGLPIYAQGFKTKNRAVIDIDLQRRLNIDTLLVTGQEDQVNLEYNLGIATSAVYNSDTSGTHTVCYNPSPSLRTCFERQNQGFNIQALNDGIRLAENGVSAFGDGGASGAGGANAAGATYYYTNGDSEFAGVYEFVNQAPSTYDFQRDPIGLECFFSSQTPRLDKPVGKVKMYFKEKKNQRAWSIEYLVGQGGKGGNGTKPGFSFVPEDTFNYIKIDDIKIESLPPFSTLKPSSRVDLLLANPARFDTIAADGTVNPQKGIDYVESVGELGGVNYRDQVSFVEAQWNVFEWGFDAIRTPAIRWFSDYHWSTKISEMEVYGVSSSDESLGDNIQIFFSADGKLFSSGELTNANEKEATFKVGNSPQFLRIIVRPTLQTAVNDVKIRFEEDQVCFGEEGRIQGSMHLDEARVGANTGGTTFSGTRTSTPLKITNTMDQTADLIIDIPEDIQTAKQLLYFNRLNEASDIQSPQVGSPGRVDFNDDKILKEQASVMVNAKAYGLVSLVSGTESYISSQLAVNGGFATGDLTGWDLSISASGTADYQIPRVADFSTASTESIQGGNYSFGFNMDYLDPSFVPSDFTQITFELSQTTDLTEFFETIDQGAATLNWGFRYANYHSGGSPDFRLLGAPTLSGVMEPPNTIIDDEYGSNQLAFFQGQESSGSSVPNTGNVTFSATSVLKTNTRFVRMHIFVNAPTNIGTGINVRQIWHMDAYSATLNAPAVTLAKWYKSYFTGVKDFTDAAYVPVDPGLITVVTGTHHWYQPARQNATISTGPITAQSQGYSQAFSQDRSQGIQSFARMTPTDPGILGMQWSGEKNIAGIRIAHQENVSQTNCGRTNQYPRLFDIEVLKTKVELGGTDPDANETTHWKVIRRITSLLRDEKPSQLVSYFNTFGGTHSKIVTFVFDPIFTEGIRIVYTQNCDIYEREIYPPVNRFGFANFLANVDCPDNVLFSFPDFTSQRGIYAGMFTALESVGRNTLPIDNTVDRELTPGVAGCGGSAGTVYVAVDLGRHFDIETNSDLFELVSQTLTQTPWPSTPALFSDDDTDDPNQVDWSGSAQFARWLRFVSIGEEEFEPSKFSAAGGVVNNQSRYQVSNLPQAILQQARIYPRLQTASIPLQGSNHFWKELGDVLTDNSNVTFINYSDYPVICFDLNRPYKLKQTSATTVLRRDLIAPGPPPASDDKQYWDRDDNNSYAYPVNSAKGADNPSFVEYANWGGALPTTGIRWVAIRGLHNLLQSDGATTPKQWNFNSQGGILFGATFAPEVDEIFTENSNWFSTRRSGLVDISTFNYTSGNLFSPEEGVDYGASHNSSDRGTIGDPFDIWDGKFDLISDQDYWSVYLRDDISGFNITENDFPHFVWRQFKDPYRGEIVTKEVKAVTILGFDDNFYPTDFQIQTLNEGSDPTLNTSWTTPSQSTFTSTDSYNEGIGFTFIYPVAIETTGIRIYITDSVYPPDDSNDLDDLGRSSQTTDRRGPQTKLVSVRIFEEDTVEAVLLGTIDTNHAWGATASSLTPAVPDHDASFAIDENNRTFFQSTGFEETITINLGSPKTINRFEWILDEDYAKQVGTGLRTNAPATFTLKANSLLSGFETILFEEDFVGITYSGTLNPPVTADTWVLEVDSVQGQDEDASSIIIHEIRLIEEQEQVDTLVVMSDVFARRPGSLNQRSTQITYAKDTNAVASVVLDGIDANNDPYFSERDFFTFWLFVNDISLLDTKFGFIRIGNNKEVSYTWNISELNLTAGWNELKLQFKGAADKAAIIFQPGPNFNLNTGESQVDFTSADFVITSSVDGNYSRNIIDAPGIKYFELEFRGVNTDRELVLYLDDMRFIRNRFDDVCKFTPSLYLNNSETFTIFTEGLDISIGTVEFWFQPDWDETGRIDQKRNILPSIFKILRPDGKYLTFFFRPGIGFVIVLYDAKRFYTFQTLLRKYQFSRGDTMHIAVVWDVLGRIGTTRSTLQVIINGEVIFGSNQVWDAIREGGSTLMFGGEIGQGIGATPHNETATTFTAVPTLPQENTASSWALIENIKLYNYAKTDFSDIHEQDLLRTQLLKPSEMIEISLDEIEWHGAGSDTLPLVVRGVPSDSEGTVYIRSNIPRDITGDENRDASLLVRWKTPLVNCD